MTEATAFKLRLAAFLTGLALVLAVSASFIVRENESVVVLRFGKPVRVLSDSGWYSKLPWPIDRTIRLDARLQHGDLRLSETLTQDKRNVIVPMYYAWRIADPARYLARVGDSASATEKLDALVTSARNAALGRHAFEDLVSLRDGKNSLATLETEIAAAARPDAEKNLGIALVDLGILQVNLPQANTESVFRRMRAERKREASHVRAEGRREAETARAETDKEVAILLADARRYAEETRGTAEAEAARIYAESHGQDPAFYSFLRQLQSLRSVVDKNTTLILDTDAAPFALLKTGPSATSSPLLPASRPETIAPRPAATAAALDPR